MPTRVNPRHRDFSAVEIAPDEEGPTFTLAGELLHCLPMVPPGAFKDLRSDLDYDACYDFIRSVLVDEDQPRYDEVMRRRRAPVSDETDEEAPRPYTIVKLSTLYDITMWLLGRDGGGLSPFAPEHASGSSNGRARTPSKSANDTSPTASDSAPSASTTT